MGKEGPHGRQWAWLEEEKEIINEIGSVASVLASLRDEAMLFLN